MSGEIAQTEERMERRINNIEVKNLMDAVGKAFFDFESKARPGTKGGTEEEALAKFTQLNNEIDALELSFTKLVNASRATNTDREHYEAMRQKSGEESDAVNRTIEAKKVELEEASKVREFYLECEKLKEGIVQIPSCSKLNKNIAETRKEAETIKERATKADVLNEHRKLLVSRVVRSVEDLERSMEDPKCAKILVDQKAVETMRRARTLEGGDADMAEA